MGCVELLRDHVYHCCLDNRNYPRWLSKLPSFRIQLGQDDSRWKLRRPGHLVYGYWDHQPDHRCDGASPARAPAISIADGDVQESDPRCRFWLRYLVSQALSFHYKLWPN